MPSCGLALAKKAVNHDRAEARRRGAKTCAQGVSDVYRCGAGRRRDTAAISS